MAIDIKRTDLDFNIQLKNISSKIGKYATALGLTPAEVTSLQADAAAFDYLVNLQAAVQTFAATVTSYKNGLRKGEGAQLGALPVAPVLGTAPAMPAPNLEGRLRANLQRWINHPAYTVAIGEDLGIEGAKETFSLTDAKPKFHIELSSGRPNLRWTKGKFEGVIIYKDSGKGFERLDRDMKPDYLDESPLPPVGTSVVWRYKMKYLINDQPVGEWSDVMSITVTGGD
ncbi:MAG TPA: hypothetical protein VL728_12890 [Cyclobacteriaceae bacterium]|jgi:hypothetical protein|nr:hypothetical protein [Cyclobacteriaceae bacterium]